MIGLLDLKSVGNLEWLLFDGTVLVVDDLIVHLIIHVVLAVVEEESRDVEVHCRHRRSEKMISFNSSQIIEWEVNLSILVNRRISLVKVYIADTTKILHRSKDVMLSKIWIIFEIFDWNKIIKTLTL